MLGLLMEVILYGYSKVKPNEKPVVITIILIVTLNLNLIFFLRAYQHQFSRKKFNQTLKFVVACILGHNVLKSKNHPQRQSDKFIVSIHTFSIWQKLAIDQEALASRSAFKIFGSMTLDYASAIRINLIMSYGIMLFLIYRKLEEHNIV